MLAIAFSRNNTLNLFMPGLCDSRGPAILSASMLFVRIHLVIDSISGFLERSIIKRGFFFSFASWIVSIVPFVIFFVLLGKRTRVPSESLMFNFVLTL